MCLWISCLRTCQNHHENTMKMRWKHDKSASETSILKRRGLIKLGFVPWKCLRNIWMVPWQEDDLFCQITMAPICIFHFHENFRAWVDFLWDWSLIFEIQTCLGRRITSVVWTRCSVLIQRYGVNVDGSRWGPERDDTLRLEDVKHDGVRWFQSVTVSRG